MKTKRTFKRYTITAALPYANGPIHIGHIAGVYLPADIYVRYLKAQQKDVIFICGSDEHGVPVTIRARQEGVPVQEIVDRYHKQIQQTLQNFGISFTYYGRTSAPYHHEFSSSFFKDLNEQGIFEENQSLQFYDEQEGVFLADRYITGTCPNCKYEEAYGDQCENCGSTLSPFELINPKSALSGSFPIKKETKHWYLPLQDYQKWLEKWILEEHKDWKANVYGQCKSWLQQGLKARAVTRDQEWGVPVPIDGADGKVLYVWFDAPLGYISATKKALPNDWEKYWKDKDTYLIHFLGKDNIVFHCIIFPTMLKANGTYILPQQVPANEFLNLEGRKISTSKNYAVWLHEYLEDFPNGQDVLRYVLCSNMPENKDNDFTWKDFQAKNNNELVGILGNFVNRTLVLTQKYYLGKVPVPAKYFDLEEILIANVKELPSRLEAAIEGFKFREALSLAMELARIGNKYLAETEPWKLAKENPERVKTILYLCIQLVAKLGIVMDVFLPFTAIKLKQMLSLEEVNWKHLYAEELLRPGHQLQSPSLLFQKIEEVQINNQIEKLEQNLKKETKSDIQPAKAPISFDEFQKMDIRNGTIVQAQKVPKSKKLLKLLVDIGLERRTIVSGIAQSFDPKHLIGKQVCVLINLAPRKIMGINSEGMLLMGDGDQGELALISPVHQVPNGSQIS